MSVRIVTDSGCEPGSLHWDTDVSIVPLVVTFGKVSFTEAELCRERFWQLVVAQKKHPKSSQPSVGAFLEVFDPLVSAGHEVVCLTLTSKHSGTYNSASIAAREFGRGRVTIVDSLSASLGLGFQVELAATMALKGSSVEGIVRAVEWMRERVRVFAALDTMEYAERGGRAQRLMPVLKRVAGALKIKPLLNFVGGELRLASIARTGKQVQQRLLEELRKLGKLRRLGIMHTRLPDWAQTFADRLADELDFPRELIVIAEAGLALSAQGGPGIMAFAAVV